MTTKEGIFIKDLSIIKNRNHKDILMVDNSVYSFGFQLANGVPIIPFFDDPQDQELLHLTSYVMTLAYETDVRVANTQTF